MTWLARQRLPSNCPASASRQTYKDAVIQTNNRTDRRYTRSAAAPLRPALTILRDNNGLRCIARVLSCFTAPLIRPTTRAQWRSLPNGIGRHIPMTYMNSAAIVYHCRLITVWTIKSDDPILSELSLLLVISCNRTSYKGRGLPQPCRAGFMSVQTVRPDITGPQKCMAPQSEKYFFLLLDFFLHHRPTWCFLLGIRRSHFCLRRSCRPKALFTLRHW